MIEYQPVFNIVYLPATIVSISEYFYAFIKPEEAFMLVKIKSPGL